MARLVTVNVNHTMVEGVEYQATDVVRVSDDEFTALTAAGRFTDLTLTDGGNVANEGDEVYDQSAVVAAPAALTSVAPAALTSAQITGGQSPTEGEYNQAQADIAALRVTAAALVVDVAALRVTLAATLVALKGTGKPIASA